MQLICESINTTYINLALCYNAIGNHQEAINAFNSVLNNTNDSNINVIIDAYFGLGKTHFDQNRNVEAERFFNLAYDLAESDGKIKKQLKDWEDQGYGNLPICMAKTQYSFTTDQNLRGAPTGFDIPVREVRLSAGAGFIVVITGEIMTMPGLPRTPAAESIYINESGQIEGLF